MKTFSCPQCGAALFFENDTCLTCGAAVMFDPNQGAFEQVVDASLRCANGTAHAVCNWRRDSDDAHCIACRTNVEIPDLSVAGNVERWRGIELAKRWLFYSLLQLGLGGAVPGNSERDGLRFVFNASVPGDRVTTGHDEGLVTLDIAEADPVERLQRQLRLSERYRTVLGHMRHETGHYYWLVLVEGSPALDEFRMLFGDERADYQAALEAHYARETAPAWHDAYVSDYASAHPHEDWAETFAHYLHIHDTLDTAGDRGLIQPGPSENAAGLYAVDWLLNAWGRISVDLNLLSRSMGYDDFYPFVLSDTAQNKLRFVHRRIVDWATASG